MMVPLDYSSSCRELSDQPQLSCNLVHHTLVFSVWLAEVLAWLVFGQCEVWTNRKFLKLFVSQIIQLHSISCQRAINIWMFEKLFHSRFIHCIFKTHQSRYFSLTFGSHNLLPYSFWEVAIDPKWCGLSIMTHPMWVNFSSRCKITKWFETFHRQNPHH